MGAVLDLLRHAAAMLATEANAVSDNPLVFARTRRDALRRQLPRRAGRVRRRQARAWRICEIGSLSERRIALLVDPDLSGLPPFLTPEAGAQLRLHDRAGDGGGAGLREQAARPSGVRRFAADLGQPGGPRLDGDPRRAPARRHGGEHRGHRRHRAAGGRAGVRLPCAAAARALARARSRGVCASACRFWDDDRFCARHRSAPPIWSRSGALCRRRPATVACPSL